MIEEKCEDSPNFIGDLQETSVRKRRSHSYSEPNHCQTDGQESDLQYDPTIKAVTEMQDQQSADHSDDMGCFPDEDGYYATPLNITVKQVFEEVLSQVGTYRSSSEFTDSLAQKSKQVIENFQNQSQQISYSHMNEIANVLHNVCQTKGKSMAIKSILPHISQVALSILESDGQDFHDFCLRILPSLENDGEFEILTCKGEKLILNFGHVDYSRPRASFKGKEGLLSLQLKSFQNAGLRMAADPRSCVTVVPAMLAEDPARCRALLFKQSLQFADITLANAALRVYDAALDRNETLAPVLTKAKRLAFPPN